MKFYDVDGIDFKDSTQFVQKISGNEVWSKNFENRICAKVEELSKGNDYYVKKNTVGPKYSLLANPFGAGHIPGELSSVRHSLFISTSAAGLTPASFSILCFTHSTHAQGPSVEA